MKILNRYSSLFLALSINTTLAAAAPSSTSAYHADAQNSYVEDETSRGIGQVNMITCIMSALRADALVNEGGYNALIDQTKCDPSARSGSGDAASQASSFMNATVNSTRASNNDPMLASIWIDEDGEDFAATIFVRLAATQAPSAANPYGLFRVDYCGKGEGQSSCMMNGYLESAADGIRYFEDEQGDNGTSTKALRLNATGTTAGSGRLQANHQNGEDAFDFAYNSTLFRRSDGTHDQCFSRDASDAETGFSVWRYGLYDANTGARVTRNSGFPIEFTNGGETYHGYLGYHGLSLPSDAANALTSGSTVQKVDYTGGDAPTKTDYTVVKSAGKLLKFTRHARTLQSIDKIKFTTFVGDDAASFFAGAQPFTQYELYWDDAGGVFKVTGQQNCGQNGCHVSAFENGEETVAVAYWQNKGGVQGWSQSLGGEVFVSLNGASGSVDSAAIEVVYRTQDLVYPSQLPATLYCVRDCPTAATMASYFAPSSPASSPFVTTSFNNWSPTQAADVVVYDGDAQAAVLNDGADQAVTFTDREAMQERPQYQWGVRSGRLFTTLADAECTNGSGTYCDHKVNQLEVYYQWETGPNSHNQFAAVKDASGDFVSFDAPLNVTFDVPDTAAYGEFAGQSLVLQYGGFGDLWGIPGQCVSRSSNQPVDCGDENARYVAAFVIPFDATVGRVTEGATTYLVKWLEREIRFAKKDTAVCSAAGLNLPSGIVLPTASDLKDTSSASSDAYIGTRPAVSAAPRVIHGEVKF
jgi:hypothetical protein